MLLRHVPRTLALAGLLTGTGRAYFPTPAGTGLQMLVYRPALLGLAGGGWDLRDDRNRPLHDPALERAVESASVETAYRQAFYKETPTFSQVLELIRAGLGGVFWKLVTDCGKVWSRNFCALHCGVACDGMEADVFLLTSTAHILGQDQMRVSTSSTATPT